MAFNPGDVVWQARHAPEGRRFKIIDDDGVIAHAKPVSVAVFEESEGNAGKYTLSNLRGEEPVELASANLALAKD